MPIASIVIPCFNAERYIEEALDSALAQTVRDTEVICVDDGSTDSTPEILARYAALDRRISVVTQQNAGNGAAREAGRRIATGRWLAFPDSDDVMEPTLLEDAIACAERAGADVVVYRARLIEHATGELLPCDWAFRHDWVDGMAFRPQENPSRIFNSFQNWAWNKLFRREFVESRGIRFQSVRRTGDLLFTCRALAEAEVVALLDKPLYRYRVNNPQSAINTSDRHPLDFHRAFLALRESLEGNGIWELYRGSFVSWAKEGVAVNLRLCRSWESMRAIAGEMRSGGLEALGIDAAEEPGEKEEWWDHACHNIVAMDDAELAFWLFAREKDRLRASDTHASELRLRIADRDDAIDSLLRDVAALRARAERLVAERAELEARVSRLQGQASRLQRERDAIEGSVSFKAGRAVTAPVRKARDMLTRMRKG